MHIFRSQMSPVSWLTALCSIFVMCEYLGSKVASDLFSFLLNFIDSFGKIVSMLLRLLHQLSYSHDSDLRINSYCPIGKYLCTIHTPTKYN